MQFIHDLLNGIFNFVDLGGEFPNEFNGMLLKRNPAPDKEQSPMAWVQHMNSLKAQAEELVLTELIYS